MGHRRTQELDNGEGCCEMLSSGHDMINALMNSQQLWSPAHNQVNKNQSVFQCSTTGLSVLQKLKTKKGYEEGRGKCWETLRGMGESWR